MDNQNQYGPYDRERYRGTLRIELISDRHNDFTNVKTGRRANKYRSVKFDTGGRLNINMLSYQYRDALDRLMESPYLERLSLYWEGAQDFSSFSSSPSIAFYCTGTFMGPMSEMQLDARGVVLSPRTCRPGTVLE